MGSRKEKELADEFDLLSKVNTSCEVPAAPPEEFNRIMTEMNRRGIKPKIIKELKGNS